MTFLTTKINDGGVVQKTWNTALNSTSETALETPGAVREHNHPVLGFGKFKYVRFLAAASEGDLCTFKDPIAISNITAGTTSSITTTGLTEDLYVGALLRCTDDAGAAGAAPEGEIGVIASNTATVVTLDAKYGTFSASPAVNDDFQIIIPFGVVDSAAGAWEVGIGTYTSSGTTLSRTTVLSSSSSGSLVNFAANSKDVFVTYPSEKAVYQD